MRPTQRRLRRSDVGDAGGLELEPAVGVVRVAHAELDAHLAARALLHRGEQQLEALAVGGVHVLGEVVDLGRQLAGLEAEHRLHHGADLDLVAPHVPFPDRGACAVDGERPQLLLARLRAIERLERAEGVLRDGEADQHDDQHQPGRQPEHDDVAREPAGEGDAGAEQPNQQQHPGRHQRQRAVLPAQRQEQRQRRADAGDGDAGQAGEGGGKPRIEKCHGNENELRRYPQPQQHAHEAVPGPQPQEGVEEDEQRCRHGGLGGGTVLRVLLGAHVEQLVPEAEVHAQVGQHAPGEDRRGREDRLVIGGKHRGQEDGEQAGDAEHDAVEKLAVPALLLVLDGLPQVEAREALGGELGDEGDGLAGLERQAEDVGTVVLDALGHKADGGGDGIDAPRVEIGPHHARADRAVAVRHQPALDGLVGGVGESEHEPGGIGAGRCRPHRHAPAHAVGAGSRLDLQGVAARFIGLAERGDLDAVGIVVDLDGLEREGGGRVREQQPPPAAGRASATARQVPRGCAQAPFLAAGARRHQAPAVSRSRIVLQQGEKIMILPNAVDLQVAARHAFALEARLLEHARGGQVVRQARGLQPMQAERAEGEGHQP